jgi:hypothetical protein
MKAPSTPRTLHLTEPAPKERLQILSLVLTFTSRFIRYMPFPRATVGHVCKYRILYIRYLDHITLIKLGDHPPALGQPGPASFTRVRRDFGNPITQNSLQAWRHRRCQAAGSISTNRVPTTAHCQGTVYRLHSRWETNIASHPRIGCPGSKSLCLRCLCRTDTLDPYHYSRARKCCIKRRSNTFCRNLSLGHLRGSCSARGRRVRARLEMWGRDRRAG